MNELTEKKENKTSLLTVFTNGVIKENPVLVLLLGTCPALAVTTSAVNGIGMGVSTMLVLLFSNILISLLKNIIPARVRIPCYIVIIAGFVTVVGFIVQAYAPDINKALGIFLPLIVVNCIILGRAEMFASRNGVIASTVDGIGMGAGFTLALFIIGGVRELIGSGMLFGIPVTASFVDPMGIMLMPPGGFFVFGCLIAVVNKIMQKKKITPKQDMGCSGCPSAASCSIASSCSKDTVNSKQEGDK